MTLSQHDLHVLDELERQLVAATRGRWLRAAWRRASRPDGAATWLLGLAGLGLIAVGLAFGDARVAAALVGYVMTVLTVASVSTGRHRRGRHRLLRGLQLLRHYGPGPGPRA